MQLRQEQLASHLQKTLSPIYLISGDVPLLVQEAREAVQAAALKQGYLERHVFQVETGFAWQSLLNMAGHASLFDEKQLLDLRLNGHVLGETGIKTLQTYTARLPTDKILLITMEKLAASAQRAAWFQAVLKMGVVVQIWPLERAQLPRWIAGRLAQAGGKTGTGCS